MKQYDGFLKQTIYTDQCNGKFLTRMTYLGCDIAKWQYYNNNRKKTRKKNYT